jgi:hypothetical protein
MRQVGSAISTVVFGGGAPRMLFLPRAAQAASTTISWQNTAQTKTGRQDFLNNDYPD